MTRMKTYQCDHCYAIRKHACSEQWYAIYWANNPEEMVAHVCEDCISSVVTLLTRCGLQADLVCQGYLTPKETRTGASVKITGGLMFLVLSHDATLKQPQT